MKYNPLILLLCGVQTHYHSHRGFPDSAVIKNPPANAEDTRDAGSVPGFGRSTGEGNGNPLQYSRLENSMDRRVWLVIVHGSHRVGHD